MPPQPSKLDPSRQRRPSGSMAPVILDDYRGEIGAWIATDAPGIFMGRMERQPYQRALKLFLKYMGWTLNNRTDLTLNSFAVVLSALGFSAGCAVVNKRSLWVLVLNVEKVS